MSESKTTDKSIQFYVECVGRSRALTIKVNDSFESVINLIKNSFNITGVPKLVVDGKEVKEEDVQELNSFEFLSEKTIRCEVYNTWTISAGSESGIDYGQLEREFGVQKLEASQIQRFERITGKPVHPWLRRGFFFSHNDFDKILEAVEEKRIIYLYTDQGPSLNSLHLGQIVQLQFTRYLQEVLGCVVVIQLANDEKFLFKDNLSIQDVERNTFENAKDIIACGFDPEQTFIFSSIDYFESMYRPILTILKHTVTRTEKGLYGLVSSDNVGCYSWPCIQVASVFSASFPHLFGPPFFDTVNDKQVGPSVPANTKSVKKGSEGGGEVEDLSDWNVPCLMISGIDGGLYVRHARDVSQQLHFPAPAALFSRFVPALTGIATKMSASAEDSVREDAGGASSSSSSSSSSASSLKSEVILMNTDGKTIKKLVNSAFSIGANTLKEQHDTGAKVKDLSQDVPYTYLTIFDLEADDKELLETGKKYLNGEPEADITQVAALVTSGNLKKRLVDVLVKLTAEHQARRALVSNEQVRLFMQVRPLRLRRDSK